jgi:hypothetical protein
MKLPASLPAGVVLASGKLLATAAKALCLAAAAEEGATSLGW